MSQSVAGPCGPIAWPGRFPYYAPRRRVPEPIMTCPECGKHGTISNELSQVGTGTTLFELAGLDLDHCDGCRDEARRHGFVAIRLNAGTEPSTVQVRLADDPPS